MAYITETLSRGGSLADRYRFFRAALAERAARYKLYRRTQNELANLSDRDLADLGIMRADIDEVAFRAAYGN